MAVFRTDYIRKLFTAAGFEEAVWQKAFHRHPTERVRRKLRAVRAFALGQPIREVAQAYHLQVATIRKYLTVYIQEGFSGCTVPGLGTPPFTPELRSNLWDNYHTAAPAQRRQYGALCSKVQKAYKR